MEWPNFEKFVQVDSPTQVVTCGPLVYLRTLKCASSFFWASFCRLKWSVTPFDQIDWKNQHVFSYILDPDIRRHKAIAQVIHVNNAYDLFYNNEEFRKSIEHLVLLDRHSVSLFDLYGDHCKEIDWIPLTGRGRQQVIDKTNQFLVEIGNVKIFNRWAWDFEHVGTLEKKKLEQDLAELWSIGRPTSADQYLQRDRDLHNHVITRFDYDAPTWAESSWLRR
jgi:hypothetical protein